MGATFKQTQVFTGVSLAIAQKCVGDSNRRVVVPLGSFETICVQGRTIGTTAWSTAVVELKFSNFDDGPWVSHPDGSITKSAEGLFLDSAGKPFIDVSAFSVIMLETTTAQAGVAADFAICGFGRK
jgi:hypothetical protein